MPPAPHSPVKLVKHGSGLRGLKSRPFARYGETVRSSWKSTSVSPSTLPSGTIVCCEVQYAAY